MRGQRRGGEGGAEEEGGTVAKESGANEEESGANEERAQTTQSHILTPEIGPVFGQATPCAFLDAASR